MFLIHTGPCREGLPLEEEESPSRTDVRYRHAFAQGQGFDDALRAPQTIPSI